MNTTPEKSVEKHVHDLHLSKKVEPCQRCKRDAFKDNRLKFSYQTKTHGIDTVTLCPQCAMSFLYASLAVGLLKIDNIHSFINAGKES